MRLRIRHANGMATLSDITADQTVLELKEQIVKTIGLDLGQNIQVSGGYPPKPINEDTITLSSAGLRDGDTLNIKILDTPIQQTTAAPLLHESTSNPPTNNEAVATQNGYIVLRVMEDDNSCLFRSIVIVDGIRSDPSQYSDVTLGQPRDKYMEWIKRPNSWGGAIELAIFSAHFGIEIDSIDVQTGRIDKFGEGSYDERILIVYSGIHYDAIALAPTSDSPVDFDQTRFPVSDESVLVAAKELADNLRKKHRYTDIANFTLKCEQCGSGLKGEKDAQDHATATGHTHFTEYQ